MFETFEDLLNYRQREDLELAKDYKCKINDNVIYFTAKLIKNWGIKLSIKCDWHCYYQLVDAINDHKFLDIIDFIDFNFSIYNDINNRDISCMMFSIDFYDKLCIYSLMSAGEYYNQEIGRFFNNLPKITQQLTIFGTIYNSHNYLSNLPVGLKKINVISEKDIFLNKYDGSIPFGCKVIRW